MSQPELFNTCAWCGSPASLEKEVEPADVRKDGKVIKFAIYAWCCSEHYPARSGPDPRNILRRKDREAKQMSIFDVPGVVPRSALLGG